MKKVVFFLKMIVIIIFICGCDPPNDLFIPESLKLKGSLNNSNDTISMGDTLKFTLVVPNVITGSNSQSITVTSLQEAFYYQDIIIVDTINKRSQLANSSQIEIFANPGSLSNAGATVFLTKNSMPFKATLNLIPKVKGLFYIGIVSQPGKIKVNNNYEARLYVNFDVINKHNNMLINVFGPAYQTVLNDLEAMGFGRYAFYVK